MSTMPLIRPPAPRHRALPRLQNGDHLDRIEFERRYRAMDGDAKFELIEGRVYLAPPTFHEDHGGPHKAIVALLALYEAATPGVESSVDSSLRLDLDNMPRPDACLFLKWRPDRSTKLDADGCISGAPEFVAEVAASSASYDLHEKQNVYRRNGVREYMVWRTYDDALDYFVLTDGRYERSSPVDGACRSRVFPGLWFDVNAILSRDLPAMILALQAGLASSEHQAFVAELATHKPA